MPLVAAFVVCTRSSGAEPRAIDHDVPTNVAVTATALGLVLGSELGKGDLGADRCRWCDANAGRDALNGVDRAARSALRWRDPRPAAYASDVLALVVSPAVAFGGLAVAARVESAPDATPVDALVTGEAVAVGLLVNQLVKLAVARQRPYAHAGSMKPRTVEGVTPEARRADENLSFYSGHTSLTFTLATASGTVAALRDYPLAPAIGAAGLAVAFAAAWLRIAADKHYLTDVVAGALAGAAAGVLLPLAFHGRSDGPPR